MHIEMFDVGDCVRDQYALCESCSNDNYLKVGKASQYPATVPDVRIGNKWCNQTSSKILALASCAQDFPGR